MLLAKILSMRSLGILALLAYCYLGSVKPDSTVLNVSVLSALSLSIFFLTSFFIVYVKRKIIYQVIFSNRKILILIALAIVATFLSKTTIFLVPMLFAMMSISSDLRLLLKYYLFWSVLLFLGLMTLQMLGVITGGEVLQEANGVEVAAKSLGFGNPNGAFTYLFSILVTGYVLLDGSLRSKIPFTILAITSIIVIYNQTLSRTGLLCCLLVVAFGHTSRMIPWKKIKRILPILFIAFALGSVYLAVYHNQMGDAINDLMSNRPYWWGIRVEDGALSNFLGNADSFAKGYAWWLDSAPLDSFFLRIWFSNGLLILIIFFIFFRLWSKRLQNRMLVLGTFVALLYGFSEYGIMSNPGKNVILLIMMVPIFSKYAVSQRVNLFGDIHAK
jgi:hypothetical protein